MIYTSCTRRKECLVKCVLVCVLCVSVCVCVCICVFYTMPISSGATVSQKQGSYLKRYLGSLPQEKRKVLENSLEAAWVSEAVAGENEEDLQEGVKKETHSEGQSEEGDPAGEKTASKKSSTCTVL